MSDLSELIGGGGGGGGVWEYISSSSSSGAYTIQFDWVGNSGYSAYVIQFSGLTNKRAAGASPSFFGRTMYGATPTVITGGYKSAASLYNSTSYTQSTSSVILPSITSNNAYNGYLYIFNPESSSAIKKSVAVRLNNIGNNVPPYYSTSGTTDTNPITGFQFLLSGGYPGFDGIVGDFILYGVKSS